MKFSSKSFLIGLFVAVGYAGLLQGNTHHSTEEQSLLAGQMAQCNSMADFGALLEEKLSQVNNALMPIVGDILTPTIDNAISILSYFSLFDSAHAQYMQTHTVEPELICKNCSIRRLSIGELGGSLLGRGLKDCAEKNNVVVIKLLLDECLAILASGSHAEVIEYMIRTAREVPYGCPQCKAMAWGKLD